MRSVYWEFGQLLYGMTDNYQNDSHDMIYVPKLRFKGTKYLYEYLDSKDVVHCPVFCQPNGNKLFHQVHNRNDKSRSGLCAIHNNVLPAQ